MMKRRVFCAFFGIIIAAVLLGFNIRVKAMDNPDIEAQNIVAGIIRYNNAEYNDTSVQEFRDLSSETDDSIRTDEIREFIDNVLAGKIGGTAEWYVLGLSQYGDYDFSEYRKALERYLTDTEVKGASAKLKFALILSFIDGDRNYIDKTLNDDSVGGQGIMSYVFGLHLINNGYTGKISKEQIIEVIRELQHEDGGWSVTGNYGDVDVTAMVLQALAPCKDNVLREMIDKGIAFLADGQLDDGDFQSFGVRNAESTAQVITAMSALGIDCTEDERFLKNGNSPLDGLIKYRLKDGSFSHKDGDISNPSATVQAFYSVIAYIRMKEGLTPLYIRDRNEKKPVSKLSDENLTGYKNENENNEVPEVLSNIPDNYNAPEGSENDTDGNTSVGDKDKSYENRNNTQDNGKTAGYKLYAIIAVIGVCLVLCLVFFIRKKYWKNYLFAGILGAAGILIVLFTDFSSPENYYGKNAEKTNVIGKVTMSIRCDILNGKKLNDHIPQDYCILDVTGFDLEAGETVYDILLQAAKQFGISVEHEGSSDIIYISGINYLYENDYGDLSGWVYKVNGVLPSVGCGGYELKSGDVIEWCYTLDLGNDAVK